MSLKIRQFGGLKTFIDPADVDNGYFNTFKNIRSYAGYAEAQSLQAEQASGITIPAGEKLILFQYVFLDEDKQKNSFIDNEVRDSLRRNYKQNIQKYKLLITYVSGSYKFYCSLSEVANWIQLTNTHSSFISDQYPIVVNENNIVKIFFEEKAYWLGIVDRIRWTTNGYHIYEKSIELKPLVYNLSFDSGHLTIDVIDSGTVQTDIKIPVTRWETKVSEHPEWGWQHRVALYTTVAGIEQLIRFNDNDPFLWILNGYAPLIYPTMQIILKSDYDKLESDNILPAYVGFAPLIRDVKTGEVKGTVSAAFHFSSPVMFVNLLTNTIKLYLDAVQDYKQIINVSDEGIPEGNPYADFIITAVTEGNEFPIQYIKNTSTVEKHLLKLNLSVDEFFPDSKVESLVFYGRYAVNEADARKKDFEQFGNIGLLNRQKPYFSIVLSELSQNGIFLVQTIGKAIDPLTYQIIDNPDDYITINGVSFALKGSNIHFPAVGNGMVLNNIFYPENYIPGMSGDFLTIIENKLAVFTNNKEEMTIIDYQAVKGQLLFFIRGSESFRIKSYMDIVETAEGVIINLKNGIYVTNGNQRGLISLPINDKIKRNYDTSMIFYNSYEKELLYICKEGIFIYRFETQSWSEMTLEGVRLIFDETGGIFTIKTIEVANGFPELEVRLIDIVDDYTGNIHLVLDNNKVYKIFYKFATGTLGLSNVDFQELSLAKRLKYLTVDADGKVKPYLYSRTLSEEDLTGRKVKIFNSRLNERKADNWIDFKVDFTGTLYNLELDVETYSMRKN